MDAIVELVKFQHELGGCFEHMTIHTGASAAEAERLEWWVSKSVQWIVVSYQTSYGIWSDVTDWRGFAPGHCNSFATPMQSAHQVFRATPGNPFPSRNI